MGIAMIPEHRPHSAAMAHTAQEMVGGVVWQTVALAAGAAAVIVAAMTAGALELLPLWAVALTVYGAIYVIYTPLHEAVHQNISGRRQDLGWLNTLVGTVAAFFLLHSYGMHKTIHLTHHRATNDPRNDPDHWVKGGNLLTTALRCMTIFNGYFFYCRRHWDDAQMRRAFWIGLRDSALAVAALVAVGAVAGWQLAVFGYAIPAILAAMTLGFLFDYAVHTPHQARARFENTRVFVFPEPLDTLVTWAYVQQNYHGVHHAFPRIPFTRYRQFFRTVRCDIEAAGLPVARPLG